MKGIRSSELGAMSPEQLTEALSNMARQTQRPPNGELTDAVQLIELYEKRYGFSSAELLEKLERGEVEEDWDICQWLLQLRRRDHLEQFVEARG